MKAIEIVRKEGLSFPVRALFVGTNRDFTQISEAVEYIRGKLFMDIVSLWMKNHSVFLLGIRSMP